MKKNLKKLILLMTVVMTALVCFCFSAGAETWGDYSYYLSEGSVIIESYTGDESTLKIPSKIKGKAVEGIGSSAFEGNKKLKSVTVPKNVNYISDSAFSGCTNLNSVTLSEGLEMIRYNAFSDCTSLKSITIPKSVKEIYSSAFAGCTKLTTVKMLAGLEYIDDFAFSGCTSLKNISIPNSVTAIGAEAFSDTAYYNNASNWKNGVLYIGKCLIKAKANVSGNYEVKAGTKIVAAEAFLECKKLTGITIPGSVKSLGNRAFYNCKKLKRVTLSEGLESVGWATFDSCTALGSITIPDSVTGLGQSAFAECTGLKSVKLSNNISYIYPWLFWGCKNLTSIIIPDSVKGISRSAFNGCAKLKSVTFGKDLEKIDDCAFQDCASLTYIDIPDSVATIRFSAFQGCKSLKTAVIGKGVSSYLSSLFWKCTNLENVVISKNLKSIDFNVFEECENLKNIYYSGSKADWKKIDINENSGIPSDIIIHYNHSHSYKTIPVTKATLNKNGKAVDECICGKINPGSDIIVYYPKTIKLSKTSYDFNGKVQTPAVTVKDSKGNALKKGTDYTVKYEGGRKNVGTYVVTITFKGKYSGTKKLSYTIVPGVPAVIKVAQDENSINLVWNKVAGADGYRVYMYNTSTNKWVNQKTLTGTSLRIKNLKAGTIYQFKIIAYKKVGNAAVWGNYTAAFKAATKTATPEITAVASTAKGRIAVAWSNVAGETGYELWASTKKDSGYKKVVATKTDVVKGVRTDFVSGRTYYFRVRAYKMVGSSKIYSTWSAVKSVKVK